MAVVGSFVGLLLVGVLLSRDYGVSWDEPEHRSAGALTWDYIFEGDQAYRQAFMNTYGQVFEVALTGLEKAFGLTGDPRAAFLMRHMVTFLVFYIGVVFLFLLCLRRFRSWRLGLLGSFILVLSPRIFADSFYNLKDIAPLSLYIVAFYTLLMLLEKRSVLWVVLHALACGTLVSVRIVGIAVPAITVLFMVIDLFVGADVRQGRRRIALNLLSYLALWMVFTVLLWPTLWTAPLRSFTGAVGVMAHFPYTRPILYLGNYLSVRQIAWHYIPVWIAVSTPVVYTLLFVVGLLVTIARFVRHPSRSYRSHRDDLIYVAWFLGPLVAVIALRSNLYDGWRHMFFIYPAFVLLAIVGVDALLRKARSRDTGRSAAVVVVSLVPLLGMLHPAIFSILYHPHENVYFNAIVSSNMKWAKRNLELDYWGLSYRQGLEYIARTDTSSRIRVQIGKGGTSAANILPASDRERIEFVDGLGEPDYFLGDYRWHIDDYGYKNERYAVKVCGERIMAVYDLRLQNASAVKRAVDSLAQRLSESRNVRFAAVIVPSAYVADSLVRLCAARTASRLVTLGEFCRSAADSGHAAASLPALVFWVFNREHVYLEPLMYMNDRESYISGGLKFTLIGTDPGGLVGVYVMELSDGDAPGAPTGRTAQQSD